MYLIPKNLEVKLAFPEFTILKWTFQILVQDITFLVALPFVIPYALAMYEVIPDFGWLKFCCGVVVFCFTFYLVVWACPTPNIKNYHRLLIWCKRPKGKYMAPATGSQGLLNLLKELKETEENHVQSKHLNQ